LWARLVVINLLTTPLAEVSVGAEARTAIGAIPLRGVVHVPILLSTDKWVRANSWSEPEIGSHSKQDLREPMNTPGGVCTTRRPHRDRISSTWLPGDKRRVALPGSRWAAGRADQTIGLVIGALRAGSRAFSGY
jgi:hypothetical protein